MVPTQAGPHWQTRRRLRDVGAVLPSTPAHASMKRTPLRGRSVKRVQADRLRKWLRTQFLAIHPDCERCGQPASDVHEIIRRSQAKDAALRPELFVALCRSCHSWVTEHPKNAHATGYVLWSWEDNDEALEVARIKRRIPYR